MSAPAAPPELPPGSLAPLPPKRKWNVSTTLVGSRHPNRIGQIARDISESLLQLDCDIMGAFIRIEAACYQDKTTSPYTWQIGD